MSQTCLLIRGSLIICGFLLFTFHSVRAHQTGHFGGYQTGCGGTGCHDQSGQTTLTLNGPANVNPGTTADFSFVIAHPNNGYGGFNLSIRNTQGAAGTITAGAGTQAGGGEITHTEPKQAAAGQVTFNFQWTAPAQHGTYTVYGAGNAVNYNQQPTGDAYNTMSTTVTVPGATITSPNPAVSFCTGATMTINWTQTGITNVRIELSANDFANIIVISNSTSAANGTFAYTIPTNTPPATTYAVRLVNTATSAELSRVSNLIISGAPTIVLQPLTQAVCEGATVTLTVGASGSGLTYSWRKNGTAIPGATTSMYTIASMTQNDAASYDCQVTGCSQTTVTNAAVLSMTAKPVITTQPLPKTACENQSVTFSITATGDGLNYTWLRNGSPITGASSPTYTIPAVSVEDAGVYRVRVSGTCTPQALSDTVRLTVIQLPIITGQPANKTLTSGEMLKLSVTALGDSLSYQWQRNNVNIADATAREYVKAGAARADSGLYRCIVYNMCDSTISSNAVVKVKPATGPGVLVLSVPSLEIGDLYACEQADTTITGLLVNEGGSPVVVTGVSAEPSSVVSVIGLTTPLSIPSGGAADVQFNISPAGVGVVSATVTFTTADGSKGLAINGNAVTAIDFNQDTLRFNGPVGESLCAMSIQLPCPEAIVTSVSIVGTGASFLIDPPILLPMTVTSGNTFEVCVRTTDSLVADADLVVSSTGGDGTVHLERQPISSVEEGHQIVGLTIAPNPANDYVAITAAGMQLSVRILDISGRTVASLNGDGLIRWELQDSSGRRVAPGLYIAVVEEGARSDVIKILLY